MTSTPEPDRWEPSRRLRTFFPSWSLRSKFLLHVGLLVATFGIVVTVINITNQEQKIRQRLVDKAGALASLMANTATDPLVRLDVSQLRLFLADVRENSEVRHAYAFDEAGRVISDGTVDNARRDMVLDDEVSRDAVAGAWHLTRFTDDTLEVVEPIVLGNKRIGAVRLGLSLDMMKAEIARTRNENVALGLVAVAVSVLWTAYQVRSVTRPLLDLTRATAEVSKGSFDRRLAIRTGDELQTLSEAFNRMSDRLRETTVSRDDLERLVAERTAELSQANDLLLKEIVERTRAEQELEHLAFYDRLCDLPNRALFLDRLDHALRRSDRYNRSAAVLFLDLDNFKVVNDSLGHEAGDQYLVAVAERISGCLRAEDTAARFGGDEFTVLLEEVRDERDAVLVAERIQAALGAPIDVNGHEIVPSASIGIALSVPRRDTPDSLLRNADLAMYRAKTAGKAQYAIFDSTMSDQAIERLELEADLRRAIARDELRLVYQPILALNTEKVIEVEALLRWIHPSRGVIGPDNFIPLAEETGLIISIGQWVLEQACRTTRAWQVQHPTDPPIVVSVNLSARQFQHPTLVQDVARVLRETGLPPHCLKLEVTEGMLMKRVDAARDTLRELKGLGVHLALDDFGTGYSSLSYLKQFPIDTLKIDQSFIQGLGRDIQDTAIVHSVIMLARSLDLQITGEGIETREQLEQLQQMGCHLGQGYYFARPLREDQVTELMAGASLMSMAPLASSDAA